MTTANIDSVCAACKRSWPIELVQEISKNKLTWRERFECECGHGFQAAGVGLPVPGVRRALLEQLGTTVAWVDQAKSKPLAAQTMSMITGLDEATFTTALKKLPTKIYEGTEVEAEFVAAGLARAGATVRLVAPKPKKPKPRSKATLRRK